MNDKGFIFTVSPYNFALWRGSELDFRSRRNAILRETWSDSDGRTKEIHLRVWDENDVDRLFITFVVPEFMTSSIEQLLYLPETNVLFFTAGESIVTYELRKPEQRGYFRALHSCTNYWLRCADVVVCVGGYYVNAFDQNGRNLWERTLELGGDLSVEGEKLKSTLEGRSIVFDPHNPPPVFP